LKPISIGSPIFDFEFFVGAAGIRVGHRQQQFATGDRQFDGTAALARNGRNAVDRRFEFLFVDHQFLVVASGMTRA